MYIINSESKEAFVLICKLTWKTRILMIDPKVSIIHIVIPMAEVAGKWLTHIITAFINTIETKPFNLLNTRYLVNSLSNW